MPQPNFDRARESSNSEMMQAFHMLLKSVTESFTQSQKDSIELQEATLDQIRGMADSIRTILLHAMADPSRADILKEVLTALREEFEKHDTKCGCRSKEEIGRHQSQMERMIEFRSAGSEAAISRLQKIIEDAIKDSTKEAEEVAKKAEKDREEVVKKAEKEKEETEKLHEKLTGTLERLDGYGKWAIATGGILTAVVVAATGAVIWAYLHFEKLMTTLHGAPK